MIYVAKHADAVYVLHCFHKTTRKTAESDIDLAAASYKTDWSLNDETDPTPATDPKESIATSSDNVFVDLGFPPGEAAVVGLRADLMGRLRLLVQTEGWRV